MDRRSVLRVLAMPGAGLMLGPLRRGHATILMLHRFADPALGLEGHSPARLDALLAHLRSRRYPILELGDLVRRLRDGRPMPGGAVAFTLDDGYADQVRVAGPVFARYDVPATVFVVTGFADRALWLWWDRVELAFLKARVSATTLQVGGASRSWSWTGEEERRSAARGLVGLLKTVPDAEREQVLGALPSLLGVELPDAAPPQYEALSWAEAREWERKGLRFAPHTVSHPLLSKATADRAGEEIRGSWTRLREEVLHPVPVFCYPNGQAEDFGVREVDLVRSAGMLGGVTGVAGYADRSRLRGSADALYRIPRFSYSERLEEVLQAVTGLERLKEAVRGWRGGAAEAVRGVAG